MLSFILASIGTLGIAGFIALAVFAPPIAAQVAKIAFDLFDRLVSTRWGVGLLVGIACLLFGSFYFDHRGAARVQAQWDKEKIEYAAAMKRLALNAAVEADEKVQAATEAERKNTEDAEQRANDYADKLKNLPIGACGLDDGDLAAGGVRASPNRPDKRRHSK